jgi:diphthamide biosynthesis protein 2
MLDPIFDHLIFIGYTNITKHPIPSTESVILPQPPTTPQNFLPTMTPLPETTLILISEPKDSTTTLLTYHHLTQQIYTYSPQTSSLQLSSPATNLALRRRYVSVQKARDAGTVGIIVGTLGKGGYLNLISLLRKMILERGKKPYLLALGKPNPAKVANFAECDVFCIIACPESTVVDSRVPIPCSPLVFHGSNVGVGLF